MAHEISRSLLLRNCNIGWILTYHANMNDSRIPSIAQALYSYIKATPLTFDDGDADSVLELLYNAYVNTQVSDPEEIKAKFATIEECLCEVSLDMNNYVFAAVCDLCMAFEKKGFFVSVCLEIGTK